MLFSKVWEEGEEVKLPTWLELHKVVQSEFIKGCHTYHIFNLLENTQYSKVPRCLNSDNYTISRSHFPCKVWGSYHYPHDWSHWDWIRVIAYDNLKSEWHWNSPTHLAIEWACNSHKRDEPVGKRVSRQWDGSKCLFADMGYKLLFVWPTMVSMIACVETVWHVPALPWYIEALHASKCTLSNNWITDFFLYQGR